MNRKTLRARIDLYIDIYQKWTIYILWVIFLEVATRRSSTRVHNMVHNKLYRDEMHPNRHYCSSSVPVGRRVTYTKEVGRQR